MVKRSVSQGLIPRLLCGELNALPTELDKDSWMRECPRHQISIRDLDFKAPLNFSMPTRRCPARRRRDGETPTAKIAREPDALAAKA